MKIRCLFGHKINPRPTGSHPRCIRCNKKVGFYIESIEGPRLTGLRGMPVERREAAIKEMLRRAK